MLIQKYKKALQNNKFAKTGVANISLWNGAELKYIVL